MSQKHNNFNDQIAAVVASGSPSSGNNNATEVLAQILQRRLEKEERAEENREAEQLAYRQQQLQSIERSMRERNANQSSCLHRKPNYSSALNGQRDHQGNLHTVCSYCGKEFGEKELMLPINQTLLPPSDHIGGPIR